MSSGRGLCFSFFDYGILKLSVAFFGSGMNVLFKKIDCGDFCNLISIYRNGNGRLVYK